MKWFRSAMVGAACCLALSLNTTQAATATVVATADTGMMQDTPNNNMGSNSTLPSGGLAGNLGNVGPTRSIFKFDLSTQIPPDAVVTSASLRLVVTKTPSSGDVASNFGVHRMLRDWGEGTSTTLGTGQGDLATTGEATWNARFHPSTLWGVPGGQSGVDYVSTPSSSVPVDALGAYTFATNPGMVADVQAWVNNPQSNFGWMLISQGENTARTARRFAARNFATAASRPQLTVNYDLPPIQLQNVALVTNDVQFTFQARVGKIYVVQRNTNLVTGTWQNWSNFNNITTPRTITVRDVTTVPTRFYQVVEF